MNDSSDSHHYQPSLNVYNNTGGKIPFGPLMDSSEQKSNHPPENFYSSTRSNKGGGGRGGGILQGLRILNAIASFDFSQFPLLEEVQDLVGRQPAEDYNIGIVRYEYNYPPDIIIDDKTRHATDHVSRVYWEHLWKPLFPKSIDVAPQSELQKNYVFMQNHHHQGRCFGRLNNYSKHGKNGRDVTLIK